MGSSEVDTVDKWITELRDRDFTVRRAAAEHLGSIGDIKAIRPLIEILEDTSEYQIVRNTAAEALVKMDSSAIEPLIYILGNRNENIREYAMKTLVKIGLPSLDLIIYALENGNSNIRLSSIIILGKVGDIRAIDPLVNILSTCNKELFNEAVMALMKIDINHAVNRLIRMFTDADLNARGIAARTLLSMGSASVLPLTELLENMDSDIRYNAAETLEKIGWKPENEFNMIYFLIAKKQWEKLASFGSMAVNYIIKLLEDENADIRMEAVEVLVKIGSSSVDPLINRLGDRNIKINVADALTKIGTPSIMPLIKMLENKDLRDSAAESLIKIGIPSIGPLIMVFIDGKTDIQEIVAELFVKIGTPSVNALIGLLENRDSDIRMKTAGVLDKIGWRPGNQGEKVNYLIAKREWDKLVLYDYTAVKSLIILLMDNKHQASVTETLVKIGIPSVEPLVKLLDNKNTREIAADTLVKIGKPSVDALIKELGNIDSDIRWEAAAALDRIGWDPVNDEEKVSYMIAKRQWDYLDSFGSTATVPLIDIIQDESWQIRQIVAEKLGKICDRIAVLPLIKLIKDKEVDVRVSAVKALGEIGDLCAIKPLVEILGDINWKVRSEIIIALARIGKSSIDPLIRVLGDNNIKEYAAEALVKIGEDSVKPLISVLDDNNVRDCAANALARIGISSILPLINELSFGKNQQVAANILVMLGNQSIEPLVHVLKDKDENVRRLAAKALDKLGWIPGDDEEKVYYLIAISDNNAVISLGAASIEPLISVYGDNDPNIKNILKEICTRITKVAFGRIEKNTDNTFLKDPDVSKLGVPMKNLIQIIIDAESYDFHKVERFITYAVNYIDKKHLNKNIMVRVYGDRNKLHPNIRNLINNIFTDLKYM